LRTAKTVRFEISNDSPIFDSIRNEKTLFTQHYMQDIGSGKVIIFIIYVCRIFSFRMFAVVPVCIQQVQMYCLSGTGTGHTLRVHSPAGSIFCMK